MEWSKSLDGGKELKMMAPEISESIAELWSEHRKEPKQAIPPDQKWLPQKDDQQN